MGQADSKHARKKRTGGFRREVSRAALWATIERWGQRVVGLVVLALLARILDPKAFGLLSMAAVLVAISQNFLGLGVGSALIQRRDLDRAHVDAAFWLSVVLTLLVAASVYGLAPFSGLYFGESQVVPMTRWLALALLLSGTSQVQDALLQRRMDFRSLALRKLAAVVVGGIIAVAMALKGYGVWALVGEWVATSLVGSALLWIIVDWKPRLTFSFSHARQLLGFGSYATGTTFVNSLQRQADPLLLGRLLGSIALGTYTVGERVPSLLMQTISAPITRVAFPALSRSQDRVKAAYLRGTAVYTYVSFPALAGVAVLADDAVRMVFGSKWQEAIPVVRFLSLGLLVASITYLLVPVLNAANRPAWALYESVARGVMRVAIVFLMAPRGLVAVVLGLLSLSFLMLPVDVTLLRKGVGVAFRDMLGAIALSAVAAAVMVVGVLAVALLMSDAGPFWRVSLLAPLGALLYVGTHAVLRSPAQREALQLLSLALRGRK